MSEIKKISYDKINEKAYIKVLDNGLTVTIIPKPRYRSAYAFFTTKFGALYNEFLLDEKVQKVPLGVAHFLEHKLFTLEDGSDATTLFSQIGLDSNAFTDYYQTTYYFSGTQNLNQGIELLLDFVQSPYFTKESVEKEQGIIEQELRMYLDNPADCLRNGIRNNLFATYPTKYDVGGTIQSIKEIDKDILYLCYDAFYHPKNMNFLVVGDVNPEEIISLIEDNQSKKTFKEYKNPQIVLQEEPNEIYNKYASTTLEVAMPKVALAIKIPHGFKEVNEKSFNQNILRVILQENMGYDTPFYQKLLDDEIINGGFKYDINFDDNVGLISFTCDTRKEKEFINRVIKKINSIKKYSITEKKLECLKKVYLADWIKSFNSVESVAFNYLFSYISNDNYFIENENIKRLTVQDIEKARDYFDVKSLATYVIYPKNND